MNEYLELVDKAQKQRIILTKKQIKSIRYLYRDVAKDLGKRAKRANKDSLSERWLLDYQKQFKKDIKELNKLLRKDIEKSMLQSAEYATGIQVDFFNLLNIKYKLDAKEHFSTMFSKIPQQALEELISGDFYKDGKGLSERLWFHEKEANANFDYIIQKGLIEKKSVYELAKDLEDYVNPDVKNSWEFKNIYPSVGNKKIEYNSFRLAVTSISHVYQLSMQRSCKANPFVEGIEWHTSNSHRGPCCLCQEREGQIYDIDKLPLDHPNGVCYFTPVITKSMEEIGSELHDWLYGGSNSKLDSWYSEYGREFAKGNNLFENTSGKHSRINNVNYMANRFVPKFGEQKEFKLDKLLLKQKKVSNSEFDIWTDIDATIKNKAVRLYEKKLKKIKGLLPISFEIPRISIINFEKNGLLKEAIGGYKREVNTVFINSRYDTDAKILKYLKNKKDYFASIEANSPLLHELGHKYHYDLADLIANKNGISYNRAKEMFDEGIVRYIHQSDNIPDRFIENQLSGYASEQFVVGDRINRINEIMAEYFSVKDNEENSELVKFIDNYIKEVIKGDDL